MDKLFSYTSCGLQGIFLKNGFDEIETSSGIATSIHDIEGLHRTIGLSLICSQATLSQREVRFLRKEMDLSQNHLARILGVSESSVRNWESEDAQRNNIPGPADRMLRVLYQNSVQSGEVREILEHISELSQDVHMKRMELVETTNGWYAQAA